MNKIKSYATKLIEILQPGRSASAVNMLVAPNTRTQTSKPVKFWRCSQSIFSYFGRPLLTAYANGRQVLYTDVYDYGCVLRMTADRTQLRVNEKCSFSKYLANHRIIASNAMHRVAVILSS